MATETIKNQQRVFWSHLSFSVMDPGHIDQVLSIELKSFPTPWSRRAFMFEVTENDFAFYIVAHVNNRVVGYGGMWLVVDEAHITNVAVHPDYRGCGIGRALMLELLRRAAILGAGKVTLEVRVTNLVARNLYKSLGFSDKGVRPKYYSDNNEDAIIMWLEF
jgi:ribosomal-protein-alanine N-acetyltransferase